MPIMGGWITWTAIAGNLCLFVYNVAMGDIEAGMAFLAIAMGFLGIGRKIEKNGS